MTSLIVRKWRWFLLAAAGLLAGCASNPAPVVNHSFGGNQSASGPAAPTPEAHGARTFAAGGHANGTVSNGEYTVAAGDTLYSIAFANSMDVRDLAALNGLAAPYVIHPGQVLKLRRGAAAATGGTVAVGTSIPAAAPPAPVVGVPPPAAGPVGAPPPASAPVFGPVTTQEMTANGVAPESSPGTSAASAPAGVPSAAATAATAAAVVPPAVPATGAAAPTTATPPPTAALPVMPTPPPGATRDVAGITWQWPASGKVIGGFRSGSGGDGAGLDIAGSMGDPVRAAAAGTVVYSGTGLPGYGALIIVKHNDSYLSAYGHNSKRLVKEGQHVDAGQEIALMGDSGASRVELHFEIRKDGKPVDPLGYLPAR